MRPHRAQHSDGVLTTPPVRGARTTRRRRVDWSALGDVLAGILNAIGDLFDIFS